MVNERIPDDVRLRVAEMYFGEEKTQVAIAKELGICRQSVYNILHDKETLKKYRDIASVVMLRAEIKTLSATEAAIDEQIRIMKKPVKDELLYLHQNSARDLLDRAGLRAKDKEDNNVKITFTGGMPVLGMPKSAGTQEVGDAGS